METEKIQTVDVQEVSVIETALTEKNVTKAVIASLRAKSAGLKINGIEDKAGYKAVDEARKEAKRLRCLAVDICKSGREKAIKEQKDWISKEKEVVGEIEEIESTLEKEQGRIDEEEKKILFEAAQRAKLPFRNEKLMTIGIEVPEGDLLKINDEQFTALFNDLHEKQLAEKAAALKAEQDRLDKIKKEEQERVSKAEAEEKRKKELADAAEKARVEAENKAKADAERKEREAKEAIEKAEREKAEAVERAMRAEAKAKADKELAEIRAEEDKKAAIAELERKQLADKLERFKKRLLENGYEQIGDSFQKGIKNSGLTPHVVSDLPSLRSIFFSSIYVKAVAHNLSVFLLPSTSLAISELVKFPIL